MDWEKLTDDVVVAATAAFGSLMTEKSDEHFYAFALYTDDHAETISPSANSIERYEAKLRGKGKQYAAIYKWETAEWAYEAWKSELFKGIYRDLERHRKTLPESKADRKSYKSSVHKCMISALKRMDENGFFKNGREDITLFISSSDDDEAFNMENKSAKRLNPEQVYKPFLVRYGDDDAGES
jgi:Domain of unknown function (DUF4303)